MKSSVVHQESLEKVQVFEHNLAELPGPVLVLGAAYSGKSELAQRVCRAEGKTAVIGTADLEEAFLEARVKELRRLRPQHWEHFDGRETLGQQVLELAATHEQILLDSINQWIANLLLRSMQKYSVEQLGPHLDSLINPFVDSLAEIPPSCRLVLVSSEVGAGISPPRPVARLFRQLVGRCNMRIAALCPSVLLVSAGLPLLIQGRSET